MGPRRQERGSIRTTRRRKVLCRAMKKNMLSLPPPSPMPAPAAKQERSFLLSHFVLQTSYHTALSLRISTHFSRRRESHHPRLQPPHFLLPTSFTTCRNTAKIQPHTDTYVHVHPHAYTHHHCMLDCHRQAFVVLHFPFLSVSLRSLYLLAYLFIPYCLFVFLYPVLFLSYIISPLSTFFVCFLPPPIRNMPYLSVSARVLLYIHFLPLLLRNFRFLFIIFSQDFYSRLNVIERAAARPLTPPVRNCLR
jgi:hypothetical protein